MTYLEDTLNNRYRKTDEKIGYNKPRNFNVVAIWECEMKAMSK